MEEVSNDFWKKYEDSGLSERRFMIKEFVENIMRLNKLKDKQMQTHTTATLLCSYFDDIISYKNKEANKNDTNSDH